MCRVPNSSSTVCHRLSEFNLHLRWVFFCPLFNFEVLDVLYAENLRTQLSMWGNNKVRKDTSQKTSIRHWLGNMFFCFSCTKIHTVTPKNLEKNRWNSIIFSPSSHLFGSENLFSEGKTIQKYRFINYKFIRRYTLGPAQTSVTIMKI